MRGRRIQPDENGWVSFKLEPGDYVRVAPIKNSDGSPLTEEQKAQWWSHAYWLACSPNGHTANLERHHVTEHEDGTITVSPSILVRMKDPACTATKFEDIKWVELWHGYLERGVWRQC